MTHLVPIKAKRTRYGATQYSSVLTCTLSNCFWLIFESEKSRNSLVALANALVYSLQFGHVDLGQILSVSNDFHVCKFTLSSLSFLLLIQPDIQLPAWFSCSQNWNHDVRLSKSNNISLMFTFCITISFYRFCFLYVQSSGNHFFVEFPQPTLAQLVAIETTTQLCVPNSPGGMHGLFCWLTNFGCACEHSVELMNNRLLH